MYNKSMKVPFLLFSLFSLCFSLYSQEGISLSAAGEIPERVWLDGETVGARLSLDDYGVPLPSESPLMDRFFTGDSAGYGYGAGIAMLTAGVATLGGSLYYTVDRMENDSSGADVGSGLITAGFSIVGIGVSSLVMDFFRDRLRAPVSGE